MKLEDLKKISSALDGQGQVLIDAGAILNIIDQIEGSQFAAASHLRTVEQQAKIIAGMQAAPIQSGDVRNQTKEVEAALNEFYPLTTSPHSSVQMRRSDERIAFSKGYRAALASTPSAAMEGQGDYAELRKLAEDATPGPWERGSQGNGNQLVVYCDDDLGSAVCEMTSEYNLTRAKQRIANLDYIAAVNPAEVLSLLNQLDFIRAAFDGAHADRMALAAQIAAQPQAGSREMTDADIERFASEIGMGRTSYTMDPQYFYRMFARAIARHLTGQAGEGGK